MKRCDPAANLAEPVAYVLGTRWHHPACRPEGAIDHLLPVDSEGGVAGQVYECDTYGEAIERVAPCGDPRGAL